MSSTKVRSERRSPGIIAKLMGLDGLPSHQSASKQKQPLEDPQMKKSSRKKGERNSTFSNGLSKRSSEKQQEFKDVFEVSETSFTERFSFERIQKSNLTDEKMAFIRQKYADAKRSTDKKLQDSEVFHWKNDRLNLLQKPDSFSTRHISNEANKKAISKRYNNHDRRNPRPWKYNSSPQRHCYWCSTYSNTDHAGRRSFQTEEEEELSNFATTIVILKPNLGKEQIAVNIVSPPRSSHVFGSGFRKQMEFQSITNRVTESLGKKNFPSEGRFSRHDPRGSQESAKELDSNFPSSRFDCYGKSRSSCDESANEEPAVEFLQSSNSFKSNNQHSSSSSLCKESFVSREAKKRMSERWKLSHISQDKGVVSRSSTLAEMLAIPANLDPRIREKHSRNGLSNDDEPLGISSREGLKVFSNGRSYRSRSPASMVGFEKSKTRKVPEILCSDKYVIPKEDCKSKEINRISTELHYNPNQASSISLGNRPSDPNYMIPESPSDQGECFSSPNLMIENIKNTSVSEPSEEFPPQFLANESEICNSCSVIPDTSTVEVSFMKCQEEPDVAQSMDMSVSSPDHQERIQSPTKRKETDQQSPVSILELPFNDDFSSCSDCFNSLSADLHELRMQLQLLKSESEDYAEVPILVSSDEDGSEEEFLNFSEEKGLLGENKSWEFSYICEVLSDSSFDYSDPNKLKAALLSSVFPVNPLLFEELEKKHEDCTTQPRSERKLLFDRINGGILEIFQALKGRTSMAQLEGLESSLYKLLVSSQESKGNEGSEDRMVDIATQWLNLEDDIEGVGEEIERLLIDELIAIELAVFS